RGDRPREITRAFIEDGFEGFDRGEKLDLYYATMTDYQKGLCPNIVFTKPPKMDDILGSYVASKGIPQFRCAETEKFPHVTFFFNDYREEPFEGEDRGMAPSPQDVSTYDQKPEMSAYQVRDNTVEAIKSGKYGLIVVNFANPDMVGHTGVLDAAIKACETVDECLGDLLEALDSVGGKAIITADHGNSDQLYVPETKSAHTSHTLNPVEVVLYGEGCQGKKLRPTGRLGDIAPTLLKLMDLPQPEAMTGESLIAE
ncbi:MAG: alkaline phosphatase family protein, partial [Verrucomicrobiota bacterium]